MQKEQMYFYTLGEMPTSAETWKMDGVDKQAISWNAACHLKLAAGMYNARFGQEELPEVLQKTVYVQSASEGATGYRFTIFDTDYGKSVYEGHYNTPPLPKTHNNPNGINPIGFIGKREQMFF